MTEIQYALIGIGLAQLAMLVRIAFLFGRNVERVDGLERWAVGSDRRVERVESEVKNVGLKVASLEGSILTSQ